MNTVGFQAAAGADTALVILDEQLSNPPPADFLLAVHRLQPQAKRILLVKRGNWSSVHPVISGMALGWIDYHLFDPWEPLEQILYPSISEFLTAWNATQTPATVAVRIVGEQDFSGFP